jgi:hypothetical protein
MTMDFGEQMAELASCDKQVMPATIQHRLLSKKQSLERDLGCVNEAIDALNANPGVSKTLELLSRALGRL